MSSPVNDSTVPVPTADANEGIAKIELAPSSHTASVAGSDDSKIADATRDIVNTDLASSFHSVSVAGSDDSNTAAGSVSQDEDFTSAPVVPYTGPAGSAYTQDTSPQEFGDWPVYLSFCEGGPFLRLECVDIVNKNGIPIQFNQMKISKKLLCDHSDYFRAMFRHEFKESKTGVVQFVDILQEELMRLKLILISGNPNGRINIGKMEEEMGNLVRMYELADRFDMPEISRRIMDRTTEFVVSHNNWRMSYQQEVVDAPAASNITTAKEEFHRAKLLDFCATYTRLVNMPERVRLISPLQLATLIAECCPPLLLSSMMRNIDKEVYYDITSIIFSKM